MTRNTLRSLIVCLGFLGLLAGGCATTPPPATVIQENDPALEVMRELEDAFNRHDVEAMAQFWDPDVQLFSLEGSTMGPGVVGREDLVEFMQAYFNSVNLVTSVIEDATVSGPYVAFREQVSWMDEGKRKHQTAMGIYEVRGGKIMRAWYFPAQR